MLAKIQNERVKQYPGKSLLVTHKFRIVKLYVTHAEARASHPQVTYSPQPSPRPTGADRAEPRGAKGERHP